ncbi:lytic transglycosylase domain-containing protein, partial [Sphingomonas sp. CCH9-E2]
MALAAWLALACPAAAQTVADWRPLTTEAAQRFGLPVAWIERVMQAESGGRTMLQGRPIVSRAGAMGLMQLMPGTWAEMRAALGLGSDPFDPRDNILAGTAYLRRMYDRFGYPGMFAAYNAGPGRYAAYLAGRQPLPGETIAYLATVGGDRQS